MGPIESMNRRDISMESPLMFVGKSSTYGLSCRVRKMKADYMDEAARASVEQESDGDGEHLPKFTRPLRRMEFWTIPSVSIWTIHAFLTPDAI
jgi:hypothetical protein